MDSYNTGWSYRGIRRKIMLEDSRNDKFDQCKSDGERSEVVLCFFEILKDLQLTRTVKERAVILYDTIEVCKEFKCDAKIIFLLSLLNVALKLEQGSSYTKEKYTQLVESINRFMKRNGEQISQGSDSSSNMSSISAVDINTSEIFMLNNLDWNYNITLYSDYFCFYLQTYLTNIFDYISKESFFLLIDFFTECALSAFCTNLIPPHILALAILLISADQFKDSSHFHYVSPLISGFLKSVAGDLQIDLQRVENYKKLLQDYMDFRKIKIIKVFPDNFIHNTNIDEEKKLKDKNIYPNNYHFSRKYSKVKYFSENFSTKKIPSLKTFIDNYSENEEGNVEANIEKKPKINKIHFHSNADYAKSNYYSESKLQSQKFDKIFKSRSKEFEEDIKNENKSNINTVDNLAEKYLIDLPEKEKQSNHLCKQFRNILLLSNYKDLINSSAYEEENDSIVNIEKRSKSSENSL